VVSCPHLVMDLLLAHMSVYFVLSANFFLSRGCINPLSLAKLRRRHGFYPRGVRLGFVVRYSHCFWGYVLLVSLQLSTVRYLSTISLYLFISYPGDGRSSDGSQALGQIFFVGIRRFSRSFIIITVIHIDPFDMCMM
jgi:hypothetical protein